MTKNNDIQASPDIFDIEVRLEEHYSKEIIKLEEKLRAERATADNLRKMFYGLVARVDANIRVADMDVSLESDSPNEQMIKIIEELRKMVDRGIHLQQLIDAIEANEILAAQWKRLMVGLRMVE